MKINDLVSGFRLIRKSYIAEVSSEAFYFEHEKSGARLFALANNDDNKVFSISFRTPPVDDTGVAHIVEHSTLCGSRKYPLKEPFVELVKGSLNTFLNAMTYPDKTMYPVASRNDKDFQNLMDVYLDAVFYPAMRENPQILMQEGWHYEIEEPSAPLRYSGVVYNEMKGALSSPDDILETRLMSALYPDTTYGSESGGNPEHIPELTQEKFIDFHSRYYHPANSYIYLYGDMDLEEKLAYLDREYLSHFERIPVPSRIELQAPFAALKRVDEEYPVSENEGTEGKTFLALSWLMGETQDTKTMMALSILSHALLKTPAAPLKKALIDAGLGKDVSSDFEDALLQPFFTISVAGSEKERAEKFYDVTMGELKRLASEGIDRTLLEASINILEFRLREADFGSAPKGLIYGIAAMKTWLYDGRPEDELYYEEQLKAMREGLTNGYFEELIRKYFLANQHAVLMTLAPSTTLAAEREARTEKILADVKAKMSEAEVEAAIEACRALKERQQAEDSEEALRTIPVLSISDIRREPYELPLTEKELMHTRVLHSDVDTHGIGYLTLYFDASAVPQKYIKHLYLLGELLGEVDTTEHSYAELANLENLYTGGIDYSLSPYARSGEPDSCVPYFRVKAKALTTRLPHLAQLLQEILTRSLFTDAKRIRELMEEIAAEAELSLQRSAHSIAAGTVASYLTPAGAYGAEGGLAFYHFLKDFLADFEGNFPSLQEIFGELLREVFNKRTLTIGVTLPEADYKAFAAAIAPLHQSLSNLIFKKEKYEWQLGKRNEGLYSASQVQYVAKGANFIKLGHKYTGSMRVLETLLRYGYFWTKIRVQGGAYGAFTSFGRSGQMYFGSYRDPNLKETLAVFDSTAEYLRGFTASEREMAKAIIGTMSGVDMPLTPKMLGAAAQDGFLRGVTYEDRARTRREILETGAGEIRALAETISACMEENAFCVFGGEQKVKECAEVFSSIKSAL